MVQMTGNLHSGTHVSAAVTCRGHGPTFMLAKHFPINPFHALHAPLIFSPCIEVASLFIFSVDSSLYTKHLY